MPARGVLNILAEKWPLLLILTLTFGLIRTGKLRRRIVEISNKLLIEALRRFGRSGLVSPHAYPKVPPSVGCALTPPGASLSEPDKSLDG